MRKRMERVRKKRPRKRAEISVRSQLVSISTLFVLMIKNFRLAGDSLV